MFVPSMTRVICTLFIVLMEVLAFVALMITPDNDIYYWVCIGFNLLIVLGLHRIDDNLLVADLQKFNVAALVTQGAGLFFYWNELPVWIYNYAIHLITLLQVLRLIIMREEDDDGLDEDHHWVPMVNNRHMRGSKILYQE